eukprot:6192857-Pleurochrysis_carterae.AAC.1
MQCGANGAVASVDPQPVLLEVNFSPDFSSVSRFYPNFVNSLFTTLFCDGGRPGGGHIDGGRGARGGSQRDGVLEGDMEGTGDAAGEREGEGREKRGGESHVDELWEQLDLNERQS